MANRTGKRYVCGQCGTELLVTRAGDGELECCGEPMALRGAATAPGQPETTSQAPLEPPRAARPLPSTD